MLAELSICRPCTEDWAGVLSALQGISARSVRYLGFAHDGGDKDKDDYRQILKGTVFCGPRLSLLITMVISVPSTGAVVILLAGARHFLRVHSDGG